MLTAGRFALQSHRGKLITPTSSHVYVIVLPFESHVDGMQMVHVLLLLDPYPPNCTLLAGVPAFLANVPVLGSALRGVVIRSAQRMIQDIESILSRVNDTTDIHEVLRRAAKKGHAQEADKQAQALRKQQQREEATEQKRSGRGGRFL